MEWVKWVDYFEYVGMRMSVWIETFEMVIVEIKIIFCEDKKNLRWLFTVAEWYFTVAELTFWMCWNKNECLTKWPEMTRNENGQNGQKQIGSKILSTLPF